MLKRLLVNHTKSLKPVLVETSNVLLVYVLYFAETVFSWVCSALVLSSALTDATSGMP